MAERRSAVYDAPDGPSPSRSSYLSKSYSRRSKERDKYKRRKRSRDRTHSRSPSVTESRHGKSNNHSRFVTDNNRYDNESCNSGRRHSVGEWTEHFSSSGKRYYYNTKTEVSQWEKPKEWVEYDKRRHSKSGHRRSSRDRSVSRERERNRVHETNRVKSSSRSRSGGNNIGYSSSRDERDDGVAKLNKSTCDGKRRDASKNNCQHVNDNSCSPVVVNNVCNSNQLQENCTLVNKSNQRTSEQTNDKLRKAEASSDRNATNTNQMLSPTHLTPSQLTTANLPKLISKLAGTHPVFSNLGELSATEALRTIQQALQLTQNFQSVNQQHNLQKQSNVNSPKSTPSQVNKTTESPLTRHQAYHYQSADGIKQELDLLINKRPLSKSPASDKSVDSVKVKHESPPSNVKNISSMCSTSLKPSVPTLTPSLANFFREDLIQHVTGWQAELAEKQANSYAESSNNNGNHICTRVSAELKMARSLVRLTEIQSTLQEQRILFVSQQIKTVEEWRGGHSYQSQSM